MKEYGQSFDRFMGPNDKYEDGTTEVQRARMREIYEDKVRYDEWRTGMGLAKSLSNGRE